MVTRLALVLAAVASLTAAGAVFWPHVPVLLYEGYPAPIWPASGRFAGVAGAAQPHVALDRTHPAPLPATRLRQTFEAPDVPCRQGTDHRPF